MVNRYKVQYLAERKWIISSVETFLLRIHTDRTESPDVRNEEHKKRVRNFRSDEISAS